MLLNNTKNNVKDKVLVTREDLFLGLPFLGRVEACIKLVEGAASQFLNETSILLEMARNGASTYVSCEAENETDICATLAQMDIEVQEIAKYYIEKLKNLKL